MSKLVSRNKITVELPKARDLSKLRPSVFERLGSKKSNSSGGATSSQQQQENRSKEVIKLTAPLVAASDASGKLEDEDPDILEKRRLEIQKELDLQLKMETVKKTAKEIMMKKRNKRVIQAAQTRRSSSSSSSGSSSGSGSDSSSDSSSSSSSSSRDAARRKLKRIKGRRSSSSSSEAGASRLKKLKKHHAGKKTVEGVKKAGHTKKMRPRSQTPPTRSKGVRSSVTPPSSSALAKSHKLQPTKTKLITGDRKKHHAAAMAQLKERAREKEKEREKEMREKDREIQMQREREKEREREKFRMREKERGDSRTPKIRAKSRSPVPRRVERVSRGRDLKRRSPERSPVKRTSSGIRRDRSMERRLLKDPVLARKHESSRDRERRERERAEKEAAREKERREALARCQERQRERERIAKERLRLERENERKAPDRLLPRPAERERAIALATGRHDSDEKSIDRQRSHSHSRDRREKDYERGYERSGFIDHHDRRGDEREDREYIRGRGEESPYETRPRVREEREHYIEPKSYSDEHDRYGPPIRSSSNAYQASDHHERDWGEREHEREPERRYESRNPEHHNPGWEDREWQTEPTWDEPEPAPPPRAGWSGPEKIPPGPNMSNTPGEEWAQGGNYPPDHHGREWVGSGHHHREEHHPHHVPQPHEPPGVGIPPHGVPHQMNRRWNTNWHHKEDPRGHMRDYGRPGPPPPHQPMMVPHKPMEEYRRPDHHLVHPHLPPPGPPHPNHPQFHPHQPVPNQHPNTRVNHIPGQATEIITNTKHTFIRKTIPMPVPSCPPHVRMQPQNIPLMSGGPLPQMIHSQPPQHDIILPQSNPPVLIPQSIASPLVLNDPSSPLKPPGDSGSTPNIEDPEADDLSEISDDADEILNQDVPDQPEPLIPMEQVDDKDTLAPPGTVDILPPLEHHHVPPPEIVAPEPVKDEPIADACKLMDDIDLDFEEISDGELEEEARVKGLGDALGVDWASLVEESRHIKKDPATETTAKQRWQPHHILLDIGISFRMAGENFATSLLNEAELKLKEEKERIKYEAEQAAAHALGTDIIRIKKEEPDEDLVVEPIAEEVKIKIERPATPPEPLVEELNLVARHPIAHAQVSMKRAILRRKNLVSNAPGAFARGLSARQDLQLRRQLCGLPEKDVSVISANRCAEPDPVIANLALDFFQKALARVATR